MNDDEKLKELFEEKGSSNFKKVIKKAKLFSIIRGVITSILVFTVVGFTILLFNVSILNKLGNEKRSELQNYYKISQPNSYIGSNKMDDGLMTGELDYVTYRFLGNKPVFDGNNKETYSYIPPINDIYGDNSGLLYEPSEVSDQSLYEAKRYSKVGKNIMQFYHPDVKYTKYKDDSTMINKIGEDKVIEISLSFDKSYSIFEVKSMIPKDITLNWYWVDTYTKSQVADLRSHTEKIENDIPESKKEKLISPNIILYEDDVYGIKAIDDQGKNKSAPEKDFIDTISSGKTNKGENQQLYKMIFSKLSKKKVEITTADIKILGVVVTGDKDSLMLLKNKSFIRASSLGAVGDKY
ncbi:anti sigma factor C-terminal domain-containing protein [Clostridium estertheticum]|uniref:anti sigma factor C-terminal domain-containing protein n=1 Tax=Clostridium estertheticum TaxID=238834 RepID=UPI001C7D568A|nr:anti sigma factor C-terminal domain-containing protein [Clostridium estertheticum]MBX4271669.1 anti-sigma factor [Clostridium estertheticum]WLC82336.1 anti-sigma factor [Clostridium estertheticum]